MKVEIRHIRAAGLCTKGARKWFQAHDLSWSDFLAGGIDAEILEATEDPLALRAVAAARGELA